MQAQNIMTRDPITASGADTMGMALERMQQHRLHMMPVLDGDGVVLGVVTQHSILAHIVPNYIMTGDLKSVTYAPDLGLLRRQYATLINESVMAEVDTEPLLVKPDESLLSVAAALISFDKHEHALVADERKRLLGVISVGDILGYLKQASGEAPGA
jgi:CBS-domain-containing membrane protein